jgi:hypothetical protein
MRKVYCPVCFELFTTEYSSKKYCCIECRERARSEFGRKTAARKIKQKQIDKFAPVNEFIKKHYEETGVRLSYGQAVPLMERGVKNGVNK